MSPPALRCTYNVQALLSTPPGTFLLEQGPRHWIPLRWDGMDRIINKLDRNLSHSLASLPGWHNREPSVISIFTTHATIPAKRPVFRAREHKTDTGSESFQPHQAHQLHATLQQGTGFGKMANYCARISIPAFCRFVAGVAGVARRGVFEYNCCRSSIIIGTSTNPICWPLLFLSV